jgi:hypothetical protein
MSVCIIQAETLPVSQSMRKSATNDFGGPLDTYTDVPRWDGGAPSRYRKHTCRKDWRQTEHFDWLDFKPRTHAHDMRRTARRVRELKESGCYGTL